MAFLIGPAGDVDPAGQHAGEFESKNHPHGAIQPARAGLGFQMAAGEQLRPVAGRQADDIADAVDVGGQARLGQAAGQPVAGADVVGGEGRAVDAGLVFADLAQGVEVGEQAVGVDLRHGLVPPLSVQCSINPFGPSMADWRSLDTAPAQALSRRQYLWGPAC